ncbi:hypothetical protein AB0G74_08810 [Streptomyces sp. NPDC020875]|uniref:hypothetical protein n=1 Tax=Streptomyces sp. NPDC020875 TaxID=3154898 RepID=UPI0033C17C84
MLLADAHQATTDYQLDWLTAGTEEAFFTRSLIQSALPTSQIVTVNGTTLLTDTATRSADELTLDGDRLRVRQAGPARL